MCSACISQKITEAQRELLISKYEMIKQEVERNNEKSIEELNESLYQLKFQLKSKILLF